MLSFELATRSLFNRSALLLVIKIAIAIMSFAFHVLLARKLGAEQFGLFSLAMTLLLFTTIFAKQGIESALVRFLSPMTDGHKMSGLYCYVLLFSLGNIIIVGAVISIFSTFIAVDLLTTSELITLFPLIILLTALQVLIALNSSVLRGRQYPIASMLLTGFFTFTFGLLLLFIMSISSALDALYLIAYATTLACGVSFWLAHRRMTLFKLPLPAPKSCAVFQVYHVSRILFVSALATLVTQQIGIFVIAKFATLEDVSIYNIALKISLLMSYPLLVINAITAPKYAQMHEQKNLKGIHKLFTSTRNYLIAIATVLALLAFVCAETIVALFGPEYGGGEYLLKILIIGQWFNLSSGSVISILIMTGQERIHRRNTILIALFSVLATFVAVSEYGVVGAAWVTSITLLMLNLISWYYVKKTLGTHLTG
tara:strand:+ start:19468 stop:20748 length:1281 start_codon:yes stop_codon:yes gene_type:complete